MSANCAGSLDGNHSKVARGSRRDREWRVFASRWTFPEFEARLLTMLSRRQYPIGSASGRTDEQQLEGREQRPVYVWSSVLARPATRYSPNWQTE